MLLTGTIAILVQSEADVKEAFDLFDRSGSGSVSFEDFGTVVRAVGHNPTEKELAEAGSGNQVRCLSDCVVPRIVASVSPAQDFAKVMDFVKKMDGKPKTDIEGKVCSIYSL